MSASDLESYVEFVDSLREIDTLLAAGSIQERHTGESSRQAHKRDLANAVTRACVVMLVAHFEGFVKAALTELIDEICEAKPPARRLPAGLLELHTRGRIEEIFGTDGPDRIHRTRALFTTYAQLWEDDRSINPRLLSAKILTRQFTSARPEVLESVFALLDDVDLVNYVDAHVNQAIVARGDEATSIKVDIKLTEIVDRRNKIAHGDRSEKPTPFEVESYMAFLKDVAEAIGIIVQRRIKFCCSLR